MTPLYRINLGGADITGNFNTRLLTMTVTEYTTGEADKLEIELDDRDGELAVPPKGVTLEVFMGYKETGIQSMGQYTVDEIILKHMPSTMVIRGKSANLSSGTLKQQQTQNYENQSLSQIAQTIAGRNGLGAFVDPSIGSQNYTMLHQTDESDMHFLQRIARENNANFKIAGGQLIMSLAASNMTMSGDAMSITVTPTMVKPGSVQVIYPDRPRFDQASAYSFDPTTQQRVTSGTGGGSTGGFVLRHPLIDQQKAQAAAMAKLNELQRGEAQARCELALGDPSITASANLVLQGFRVGIDGTYSIASVEHNLDSAGYTTKIEADNDPNDNSDGSDGSSE